MKIAFVSPNITSAQLSEKMYNSQQLALAHALVNNGINIDIITCETEENKGHKIFYTKDGSSFDVYYLPYLPLTYQPLMPFLHKFMKSRNYDFIISSEDYQLTTFQLSILSKTQKIPLIIFQGAYNYISTKAYLNYLWKFYDSTIGKFVKNNTRFVIAKTSEAENYMRSKGYKQTQVIPVGIDLTTFKSVDDSFKKEMGIDVPIILYVGSYTVTKNIGLLLRAFSIVSSKLQARLLLVGYNELSNELNETIKEYNIENKVIVLSKIENNKMPYIYSSADLFVLSSKKEIFGMVILEAMACGLPVISTPVPAAIDVIVDGENGFIISDSDPNKLAELIVNILNDDALKESIGKNARKTMEHNYDWNQIAKQYIEVFNKILTETHVK